MARLARRQAQNLRPSSPSRLAIAAALALAGAAALLAWQSGLWSRAVLAYEDRFLTASDTAYVMGTYLEITATGHGAAAAVERAIARFRELDVLFNPADPASDMARLAANPGRAVPVSPDTIAVLERADAAYRLSGGVFDLTVGPLVSLWGFGPQDIAALGTPADQRRTSPPSQSEIDAARRLVDWSAVTWDKTAGTATLARPGMTLATGGIAKGYALDEAARILREAGVRRAVIDAGGSLYLLGSKAGGEPWRIGLRHPRQDGYLGTLAVPADESVSTSGDYERYFESGGVRYHHILDPATGWPARGTIAVSVVAPDAAEADALSTALFVLGPEKGLALASSLPGVEALFVDDTGRITMTPGMEEMFVPTGNTAGGADGGNAAGDAGGQTGG